MQFRTFSVEIHVEKCWWTDIRSAGPENGMTLPRVQRRVGLSAAVSRFRRPQEILPYQFLCVQKVTGQCGGLFWNDKRDRILER
jgi:hypothetical protein